VARPVPPPSPRPDGLRTFTDDELFAATNGFAAGRVLGEGGFGRVFRGALLSGAAVADVAVKLLDREGMQSEAEWRAEVGALIRVRHANVVHLVGVCEDGGRRRVRGTVLAAIDGPNLRAALDGRGGALPWPARLAAVAGAAAGLAAAHAAGVAHGDFASSNIIVAARAGGVLCDFGLARPAGATEPRVGQPGYAPPEATSAASPPPGATAAAADVYALGVVLAEVLTGLDAHPARAAAAPALADLEALAPLIDATLFTPAGDGPCAASVAAAAEVAAACLDADPAARPPAARAAEYLGKAAAAARRGSGAPLRRPQPHRPPVRPVPHLLDSGAAPPPATPRTAARLAFGGSGNPFL